MKPEWSAIKDKQGIAIIGGPFDKGVETGSGSKPEQFRNRNDGKEYNSG
jgi:hypothetical protein